MSPMTAAPETQPLTVSTNALNRCDRCGAQAYVSVLLDTGGNLMFCSHHWRETKPALGDRAADVVDETRRLAALEAELQNPTPSDA